MAALVSFFDAIKALLPDNVTITVPGEGDHIDPATSELVGSWTSSGGGSVVGTSTSPFALGTGVSVRWITSGIFNGRRVKGRTFIVPVDAGLFTTDGRLSAGPQGTLLTAATDLIAAVTDPYGILSRPTNVSKDNGEINAVTAASVSSLPTSLRTRRV